MTAADVRRIALSAEGYGNLMLTLEQQAAFVEEAPEIFLPIPGGWERWDTRIFAWRRRARMY